MRYHHTRSDRAPQPNTLNDRNSETTRRTARTRPSLVNNGGQTWPETGPGPMHQPVRTTGTGVLDKTRDDQHPPQKRGTTTGETTHPYLSTAQNTTQNTNPKTPEKYRHSHAQWGGGAPRRARPRVRARVARAGVHACVGTRDAGGYGHAYTRAGALGCYPLASPARVTRQLSGRYLPNR